MLSSTWMKEPPPPEWVIYGRQHSATLWGEPLMLPEWANDDNNDKNKNNNNNSHEGSNRHCHQSSISSSSSSSSCYRHKNGWHGRDLLHDVQSPVRIVEYYVNYGTTPTATTATTTLVDRKNKRGGIGTILTGIVQFTKASESHKGQCHGGGFCAVMDDVIAWCAMVVTGQCLPWSGYTVQINTTLLQPIVVNTTILAQAIVTHTERRKVYVQARLVCPQSIQALWQLKSIPFPTQTMSTMMMTSTTTRPDKNQSNNNNKKPKQQFVSQTTRMQKQTPIVPDLVLHAVGEGLVVMNKGILLQVKEEQGEQEQQQQPPPLLLQQSKQTSLLHVDNHDKQHQQCRQSALLPLEPRSLLQPPSPPLCRADAVPALRSRL